MYFLDGHLYPENQQPLIITAAEADEVVAILLPIIKAFLAEGAAA